MNASDPRVAPLCPWPLREVLTCACIIAGAAAAASAQPAVVVERAVEIANTATAKEDDDAAGKGARLGFSLRKEDAKILDKFEDFRRHQTGKAWELAFRAIGELAEADLKGMLPSRDGLYLPSRQLVWRAMADMPPDGREAFRLFNDAKARQLFEQAKSPGVKDETALLRKIYDQYFVTSVGDLAADRLGDVYFASGEFASADAAWRAILEHHADSTLPKSRLRAKRCSALARAGRWPEFEQLAAELEASSAGESLILGGRPVSAKEYVRALRASAQAAASATRPASTQATQASSTQPAGAPADLPDEPAGPLALPAGGAPLWQSTFIDQALMEQGAGAMKRMGWEVGGDLLSGHVPPSATDGKRVYVNWLGVVFALDARTGKLLWRTRKMTDVAENAQGFAYGGLNVNWYHLVLAGDRVVATGVPIDQINNGSPGSNRRIVCHNADTGALLWTNKSGTASSYSVFGPPLAVGETIYVAAQKSGQQEMHLLALELASGKLSWSLSLGTPQAGADEQGTTQAAAPTIVHHAGTIYVLTNNGALLAVDAAERRVAWALTYDAPPIVGGQNMFFSYSMPRPPANAEGTAIVRGSTLYLKETAGGALYAVDLAGPSLAWRRPADSDAGIVGIDDRQVYLLGQELSAIDLKTRAMRWSAKVPAGTAPARTIRGGDALYLFSSRGVYALDAATGDPAAGVFRTADLDAVGGAMWRSAQRLVTVSNRSVTAYPLAAAQGGAGR